MSRSPMNSCIVRCHVAQNLLHNIPNVSNVIRFHPVAPFVHCIECINHKESSDASYHCWPLLCCVGSGSVCVFDKRTYTLFILA